jgi:hypothetical protein
MYAADRCVVSTLAQALDLSATARSTCARGKGYVEAVGYTGPIEVELFNDALWARDGREVLAETAQRFLRHVMR